MSTEIEAPGETRVEAVDRVVVRFAGDSGDGIQLTGNQFTNTAAALGNDLATFPDFPAEIRAPAGSLPGVSGFQINFASFDVHTPGDDPDVLVAMNPAALKTNLGDLKRGGLLIVNTDNFAEKNLKLAGYAKSPLEDGSLEGYRLVSIPITTYTRKALESQDLPRKMVDQCKNFFARYHVLPLQPAHLRHGNLAGTAVRASPGGAAREQDGAQRPGSRIARPPTSSRRRTAWTRRRSRRGVTATSAATPRWRWGSWPRRGRLERGSSSPAIPSRRRPTCCT
jgi:Pyruvate/2-oxoacid:ferredoxin oxidoreductase gamma subunit